MKIKKLFEALTVAWAQLPVVGGVVRIGAQSRGSEPADLPFESISMKPYRIAAALSITEAAHAGRTGYFDIAAGVTVTLPRATGSGARYRFVVKTTVTSVNDVIQVANADDVMQGGIMGHQDGGDSVESWETASTSDTITLNGSTKGGLRGDVIEIEDVAEALFIVWGQITQTGTQATPFSAAVS